MSLQALFDRLPMPEGIAALGLGVHWPWALLLLLAVPWAGVRPPRDDGSITADPPPRLPPALVDALDGHSTGRHRHRRTTDRWWRASVWILLVLALAQPFRTGDLVAAPVSGRALTLVIDLSGSMERTDFTLDGEPVDRLAVVKRLAGDFLARREGDRIGLVLFGKEAFIGSPLTFDLASLGDVLAASGIGMAGRSTAIGDALGLALSMLKEDPATGKAVVLLSDGTNNAGLVEPEAAAAFAATLGVRVHTIALGSEEIEGGSAVGRGYATAASADLDEITLQAIAERADGRFFRARTTDELEAVYAEIDRLESSESRAPPARLTEDMRHLPLLAMLMLLVWRASGMQDR